MKFTFYATIIISIAFMTALQFLIFFERVKLYDNAWCESEIDILRLQVSEIHSEILKK